MNLKKLITAASIALLPITAGAATLIVPVSGSASGANGSVWKTDLTLHNTAARAITATLVYHDQSGATANATVTIPARGTVALADIVRTSFARPQTLGAIEVQLADSDAAHIAVNSRTYNAVGSGQFGQDVPAVKTIDAANAGDVVVLAGLTSAADFRMNAGLYTLAPSTVAWQLLRANGTIAASNTIDYAAGVQQQYSLTNLFNATLQDNDGVHATVTKGTAVIYGSLVNQTTGDPSFVPGIRTREESRITLLGIDRDQNGTIDIPAIDDVLTTSVGAGTIGYPTYFRIVAQAEGNQPITYEIVSSTADARLVDTNGTIQMVASAALSGTTGSVVVRATTPDGQTALFTIPVKFY
ncbi:MAG TPA: hypothetical protein VLU46_00380 [Thermoanaerobaculia bacterium]|nr:hypothetical protein [Thermoanaerobaculia bacterium]